ncbi:MAG TPA: polymer-forming cytoskeletal protein [Rhizomicrobium sp.]|nr:polymer-forming cytoskeletal protein [Rhizomicrobium sp.]
MFALKDRARDSAPLPASELGRGLNVTGHLQTEGELVVLGRVRGRIDADLLVVADGADVEADVMAREVRVAGRFTGRIFAVTVALEDGAQVAGRIFHHIVSVARGARFEGRMPWRPPQYFESLTELPETQP